MAERSEDEVEYISMNKCHAATGDFFEECDLGVVTLTALNTFVHKFKNKDISMILSSRNQLCVSINFPNDTLLIYNVNSYCALFFKQLLFDKDRDWIANLFLYSLYRKSPYELLPYRDSYLKWKREGRYTYFAYWRNL